LCSGILPERWQKTVSKSALCCFRATVPAPAWQLNGLDNYLWLASTANLFLDFVEEEPDTKADAVGRLSQHFS
jgi:hypothetical protein